MQLDWTHANELGVTPGRLLEIAVIRVLVVNWEWASRCQSSRG
jgi:hypothetical protein